MPSPGDHLVRGSVDGVPAWWGAASTSTMKASLVFRVGQADRRPVDHGWLELLLQIAMDDVDVPAYLRVEAVLGPEVTAVSVWGPRDEGGALLSTLASRLWRPPPEQLLPEAERQLRTREAPTATALAMGQRFGPMGLGANCAPRYGLLTATPDRLAAYASRVFARQNAALVLDSPPPSTLRLELPEGELIPCPVPRPVVRTPGSYSSADETVTLSGMLPRSVSALLMVRILEARVTALLRHAEGISYSPMSGYTGVSYLAVTALTADIEPGAATPATAAMTASLAQLANEGPTPEELQDHQRTYLQTLSDPTASDAEPWAHAMAALTGRPLANPESLIRETGEVTAQAVARDASYWRSSALLGIPEGADSPDGFPSLSMPETPELTGLTSAHRFLGGTENESPDHLFLVSPWGVCESLNGVPFTIMFNDAVALLTWPDGKRRLLGDKDWWLDVEPNLWAEGTDIVQTLDDAIDPDLVVPMPARDPAEIPRDGATIALDARIVRTRTWRKRLLWLGIALLAIVFGLNLALYGETRRTLPGISPLPVILTTVVARWLTGRHLRTLVALRAKAMGYGQE